MGRSLWSIFWGCVFIFVGVLLILNRLGYAHFDLGDFLRVWWPLILIMIGLNIIFDHGHRVHRRRDGRNVQQSGDEHDRTA